MMKPRANQSAAIGASNDFRDIPPPNPCAPFFCNIDWNSCWLIQYGFSKGLSGSPRPRRRRRSPLVELPLLLVKFNESAAIWLLADNGAEPGGGRNSLSPFESGGGGRSPPGPGPGGGPLLSKRRGGRLVKSLLGAMTMVVPQFVPRSTRFCSVRVWALSSQ